jgi:hypothetical protein
LEVQRDNRRHDDGDDGKDWKTIVTIPTRISGVIMRLDYLQSVLIQAAGALVQSHEDDTSGM